LLECVAQECFTEDSDSKDQDVVSLSYLTVVGEVTDRAFDCLVRSVTETPASLRILENSQLEDFMEHLFEVYLPIVKL